MFVKRRETYETNKCALHSVIWNQCSQAMQMKLKSIDTFEKMNNENDSLALLKEIKGTAYKFESHNTIYLALDNTKCAFYAYKQGPEETNADYISKFKNAIEVIEHYRGCIGDDAILATEELKKPGKPPTNTASSKELLQAKKTARSKAHAMAFLKRANRSRYSLLTTDLEIQYTRGTDQYPVAITEAYNLLVNYKKPGGAPRERPPTTRRPITPTTNEDQLSFLQAA
jgi:hypothetical protein